MWLRWDIMDLLRRGVDRVYSRSRRQATTGPGEEPEPEPPFGDDGWHGDHHEEAVGVVGVVSEDRVGRGVDDVRGAGHHHQLAEPSWCLDGSGHEVAEHD